MPRLAVACTLAVAACHDPSHAALDGGGDPADAAIDASADVDAAPDAPPDVPPDAPSDDMTAPQLVAIAPAGGDIWLHEPIAIEFDEPVGFAGATITATVDGDATPAKIVKTGDRTLAVTIGAAARGIGVLAIELAGVKDLAGNVAAPISAEYALSPWQHSSIAGVASPAIAVDDIGDVLAATITGGDVHVEAHVRGAWSPLGSPLGGGASSPALALGAGGLPVAGWIEAGTARAARWTGSAWLALPSPGNGSAIVLAASPSGAITALVIGGNAEVRVLSSDTWQPLGPVLAVGGAATSPALAVGADDTAVVGWIAGGVIRVHRFAGGAWTAKTPIVANSTRISLAARGASVAIAFDAREPSASSNVYVRQADGSATGWTQLGRALDVDVAGDASAPVVAIDANGAPIVAWRERIETAERGVIARYASGAWNIVGGYSWLASASAPTPPAIALHPGGAAVLGWAAGGETEIARFNGPAVAPRGIAARAPLAGCAFSAANPPARLLATGCFTLAAPGKPQPHAGLVPYDIVSELWSDGALKRRWIAMPPGASMTMSGTGAWSPPVGTFIIKEFALELTPGAPATRRAIETRVLVRTAAGWQGFSYQWRANGQDADLLLDGEYVVDWTLDDNSKHQHVYPSRGECLYCHEDSYGPLLGLRPQQLQRWFDYNGVIADQLSTLAALDVGPASSATPFISPQDGSATVEQRTRGYMAANCAHCHNPDHVTIKDLRYTTPLAQTRLCEVIDPGSPSTSRVYQLISSRPGMPEYGSLAVDPLVLDIAGRWITGMTSCP